MSSKYEETFAFVHVIDNKSFTKAADLLNVAKSSLSRRVNELEKRLGVQLIQRTTRKLFLTQQGENFYIRAQQILLAIDEMESTTTDAQVELKGRIKLAVPVSFSQISLSSLLSRFIIKYPKIDLHIDLNDRQIDLVEDGFDLAIRIGQLKDSSLIIKKLSQIKFVTCASPTYLKQYGTPQSPEELKNHKGLYYSNMSKNHQWRYKVDGIVSSYPAKKVFSANNGVFLAQSAVEHVGILRSPEFIIKPYIKTGELVSILEGYDKEVEGVYAIFPPGRLIPSRIRKLVEFLKKEFDLQANS